MTPAKEINCTSNNIANRLTLQIGPTGAQIGAEAFSFTAGLKEEGAGVIPTLNNLVYIARFEDKREFSITLDKHGVISLLHYKDLAGANTNCVP